MWFSKKKKESLVSKYGVGDQVGYHYRGDNLFGYVYHIYKPKDGSILYDVQVAGQCPYLQKGLKEEELYLRVKKSQ